MLNPINPTTQTSNQNTQQLTNMNTETKTKIVTEPSATAIESPDSRSTPQPPRTRRAPRRRMRRRASPQSEIRNQKSEIPHRRPRRSRPFQPLPELAHLSPDDLAEIHNTLRDLTVPQVAEFIATKHSRFISHHRLYRYRDRLDLADQLQIAEDNAPAIQNLLSMLAGKHVDLDKAGIHIIKQRAVTLAASPNSSPSLLKDLFRIFTYKDRLSIQQRRVKCHERMTKVAEKRQKLAEKKHKKENDGATMEEQMEAARELFGEFPTPVPYAGGTSLADLGSKTGEVPIEPSNP